MPIKLRSWRLPLSFFLLLCSASIWFYWNHLSQIIPARMNAASTKERSLTDLYPRWYGARELFIHHRDPYSADVTHEIQLAYDGKEQRFAYPLYVVFLLAPTVGMQLHSAQIAFWWLLAVVTVVSLALWLSVIRLQLTPLTKVTLFAMLLSSVPLMQGLSLLQFGLLVAGLLSGAAVAVVSGHLFLAGVLLALATIKPPLSLLVILWFVLWVSGAWRQRQRLLWGFVTALAVLVATSEYLVPGWVLRYPGVLAAYASHADATPLLGVFLPHALRWPVSIAGLLATAVFCWRIRRQPASSAHFLLALAFVLTVTVLIIPTALAPYNQLLLVPAVLLIFHHWRDLWSRGPLSRIVISLSLGIAILPWLLAPLVTAGLLLPTRTWLLNVGLIPLYVGLELPFAILALLLLLARDLPSISTVSGLAPVAPRTVNP